MTRPIRGRFRLSAHLGFLFDELPLAARFAEANRAGFRAIEIPNPYGLSRSQFCELCEQNDLEVAQIVVPNGTSGGAEKGLAALPGREAEFEEALMRSIAFAKAVNCRRIHPMSGTSSPLEEHPRLEVYLSNISKACSAAADEGICVIIEPISAYGARNYFMNSFRLSCSVIEAINASNLHLSIDTYHASAMGVHLPSFIARNSARIAHLQVADWPRRDEPGSGEVNFDAIFRALRASGYTGYVGMEYIPSSTDKGRFGWIRDFDDHLEPLRKTSNSSGPITQAAL